MIRNYQPQEKAATSFNTKRNSVNSLQLEHFDFICGQVMKENRILRYVVIVSCLAFFVSIGITLYAVSLPESIPVLITMNDFGETSYVGAVSRKNYQNFTVPEIAIHYQVKNFINLCYTLSTDKTVMKKSVSKTYRILTSNTASKYSTKIREEKLYEDFSSKTREVVFQTEPLRLSKDTYQIDFETISRHLTGSISERKTIRAVISIKVLQPNADDIKDNPLGIYITEFDFKEIYK